MAAVYAEVVALGMPPPLTGVVVVVAGTLTLTFGYQLPGFGPRASKTFANPLDAAVHGCRDEDIDDIIVIAKDIIGRAPYKYTAALVCCLADSVALKLVDTLVGERVLVEV